MWAVVYSFLLLIPLSACPSNLGSSMVEQITDVTAKWHHQKRRKLNFWLDYHLQLKCVLPWLNPLVTLFYYILGFDALWVPSFGEHFLAVWSTFLASVRPVSAESAGWSELRISGWAHRGVDQRTGHCLGKEWLRCLFWLHPLGVLGEAGHSNALLAEHCFSFSFLVVFFLLVVIYLTYFLNFWQKLKKGSAHSNKYPLLNLHQPSPK